MGSYSRRTLLFQGLGLTRVGAPVRRGVFVCWAWSCPNDIYLMAKLNVRKIIDR